MVEFVGPFIYTLLVWWFSTGVILYLDGLSPNTFKWTMAGASVLLLLSIAGLVATKNDLSVASTYTAFTCAVLIWAWQEVAFLLGYLTGPRKIACSPGVQGWQRFKYAVLAVLHHEITLVLLAAAVALSVWRGENLTGLWTFLVLWLMRQSAKLNIFLGVRNLSEAFLPEHLQYLRSYFLHKNMNALFPISVVVTTALAVLAWQHALVQSVPFDRASMTFIATLLSLGVLEHWFMMLPFPPETLWKWALRKPREAAWQPAPIVK
jgi:putative photosynthetic complex assembly protein 2